MDAPLFSPGCRMDDVLPEEVDAASRLAHGLRAAVEQLYAADCALQDAIDRAHAIQGPAGHVTLSGEIKVGAHAQSIECPCARGVSSRPGSATELRLSLPSQDIVAYSHKLSKVRLSL